MRVLSVTVMRVRTSAWVCDRAFVSDRFSFFVLVSLCMRVLCVPFLAVLCRDLPASLLGQYLCSLLHCSCILQATWQGCLNRRGLYQYGIASRPVGFYDQIAAS